MSKKRSKSGLEKRIYLSDILDEDYFDKIIGKGKYIIFDKYEITRQIKSTNADESAMNYIANIEIGKALTKAIRNKKIRSIIYLLYTSKPKLIIKNIEEIIVPKLNTSVIIKFNMITTKIDRNVYQYKDKDYEKIYIREENSDK